MTHHMNAVSLAEHQRVLSMASEFADRAEQAEAAIARVRELCDLTERTVLDAMPELEGKVVVYTSLVRRALDGDT